MGKIVLIATKKTELERILKKFLPAFCACKIVVVHSVGDIEDVLLRERDEKVLFYTHDAGLDFESSIQPLDVLLPRRVLLLSGEEKTNPPQGISIKLPLDLDEIVGIVNKK